MYSRKILRFALRTKIGWHFRNKMSESYQEISQISIFCNKLFIWFLTWTTHMKAKYLILYSPNSNPNFFCRNNGWIMENMDSPYQNGCWHFTQKYPKYPKYPRIYLPNLSAQVWKCQLLHIFSTKNMLTNGGGGSKNPKNVLT